jgi:hypothetical protein
MTTLADLLAVDPTAVAAWVLALSTDAILAPRQRADQDPSEHREGAGDLRRRGGVAKREPAYGGANEWLEVDEGPRHVGGNPGLSEGEEPEREQRSYQRQDYVSHHSIAIGRR